MRKQNIPILALLVVVAGAMAGRLPVERTADRFPELAERWDYRVVRVTERAGSTHVSVTHAHDRGRAGRACAAGGRCSRCAPCRFRDPDGRRAVLDVALRPDDEARLQSVHVRPNTARLTRLTRAARAVGGWRRGGSTSVPWRRCAPHPCPLPSPPDRRTADQRVKRGG